MPGTTTGEDRTAPSISSHPGPTTLWPIFTVNRSSADQSSAASSTNTSEPHRSPGQVQWPSSGTPQDAVAGRQGGGATGRVGREDHHAHQRDRFDLVQDTRHSLVQGL